jgi:carbonic anhydrase/acetyltransferase-like protein (isoleucine patch superfamily)
MRRDFEGVSPDVAPDAFIAETAVLIGRVTIGEGSSVWFNAVLRGDRDVIRIGRFSNIQDNCTVHHDPGKPAIVGDYVTVGHGAIVHGCIVEDNVLIGMHATILSGATVGHDSIVGAGALVTEGAVIPAGSLVLGVPAKVIRPLRPDEMERVRQSALTYYEHSRKFIR